MQGGGNCANALTAAARLGLGSTIVTKVSEQLKRAEVSCPHQEGLLYNRLFHSISAQALAMKHTLVKRKHSYKCVCHVLNQLPLACLLLSSWEQMALEMELSGRLRAASSSNSKHRTLCWSCCSQANAFPGLPSHVLLPVILHATVSLKTTASTPPLCCVQQATPPPSRTSSSTVLVRKPQACTSASVLFLEAFLQEPKPSFTNFPTFLLPCRWHAHLHSHARS